MFLSGALVAKEVTLTIFPILSLMLAGRFHSWIRRCSILTLDIGALFRVRLAIGQIVFNVSATAKPETISRFALKTNDVFREGDRCGLGLGASNN